MGYYDYEEIKNKALKTKNFDDVLALGEWFENYGMDFWNGEYFEIDKNNRLYPLYDKLSEDEDLTLVGWTFEPPTDYD